MAIGIRPENVDIYLRNKRELIGEANYRLLCGFRDYLRSEGLSVWTVYNTIQRVTYFALFLKGVGKDLATAEPMDIRRFLASRGSRENVRRYAATLKKFYRFMMENVDARYRRLYRSFKIPSFKPEEYPMPRLPTREEVDTLIKAARQPYRALLALMYEGGLRRSEALLLRVSDVEDHHAYLKVSVKRSKSRPRVVLIIRYSGEVRDWLERHPWRNLPDAYLFPARQISPYKPLSPSTMYNYLSRLKKKLRLEHIHPHALRHLRATELYKRGFREKELMALFGWKTRAMIDIYSHICEDDVHRKLLRMHGLEPVDADRVEEAKRLIDALLRIAAENPLLLRRLLLDDI